MPSLGPEFYCIVTEFNLEENSIACSGPVQASSESLTHVALYLHSEDIGGIIHVHNPQLWQELLFKIPTTRKEIPYGTPDWIFAKILVKLSQQEQNCQNTSCLCGDGEIF